MTRHIRIVSFLVVEAFSFVLVDSATMSRIDEKRYLELIPGQTIRVREEDENVFQTRWGWIELPADAWEEVRKGGVQ